MYAFAPIKSIIDSGHMPQLSDFPFPLKNEDIEYHFSELLSMWDSFSLKSIKENKELDGCDLRKVISMKFYRNFVKCGVLGLFDSLFKIVSCVSMGVMMKMIQNRQVSEPVLYS